MICLSASSTSCEALCHSLCSPTQAAQEMLGFRAAWRLLYLKLTLAWILHTVYAFPHYSPAPSSTKLKQLVAPKLVVQQQLALCDILQCFGMHFFIRC